MEPSAVHPYIEPSPGFPGRCVASPNTNLDGPAISDRAVPLSGDLGSARGVMIGVGLSGCIWFGIMWAAL